MLYEQVTLNIHEKLFTFLFSFIPFIASLNNLKSCFLPLLIFTLSISLLDFLTTTCVFIVCRFLYHCNDLFVFLFLEGLSIGVSVASTRITSISLLSSKSSFLLGRLNSFNLIKVFSTQIIIFINTTFTHIITLRYVIISSAFSHIYSKVISRISSKIIALFLPPFTLSFLYLFF